MFVNLKVPPNLTALSSCLPHRSMLRNSEVVNGSQIGARSLSLCISVKELTTVWSGKFCILQPWLHRRRRVLSFQGSLHHLPVSFFLLWVISLKRANFCSVFWKVLASLPILRWISPKNNKRRYLLPITILLLFK